MALNVDKHAQEAHRFLNELAEQTGRDKSYAGRLLRATLHTFRDRISTEESLHFIAQLPLFLKGVYVDNWTITEDLDRSKTFDDFIIQIMNEGAQTPGNQLGSKDEVEKDALSVFRLLDQYISDGQWEHIGANLPPQIKEAIMEEVS